VSVGIQNYRHTAVIVRTAREESRIQIINTKPDNENKSSFAKEARFSAAC
jgi:hypothetical protein